MREREEKGEFFFSSSSFSLFFAQKRGKKLYLHPPDDSRKVGDQGVAGVGPEAVDHCHAVFESKVVDAVEGIGWVERAGKKG